MPDLSFLTIFRRFSSSNYTQKINDILDLKVLLVDSDPTMVDSDDDQMNDYNEFINGSERLAQNFFILKEDYDYVKNASNFEAPLVAFEDENNVFVSSMYSFGNSFLSGNGGNYELDRKAIIEFVNLVKSNDLMNQNNDMADLTQNVFDGIVANLDAGLFLLNNSHTTSSNKDKEALNELKSIMQRRKKEINQVYRPEAISKEMYYKQIDDAMALYNDAAMKYDVLNKELRIKSLRFKIAEASNQLLGYIIIPIDAYFSAKDTIQVYSEFFDSIREYESTIEILDIIINHSSSIDPSNVKSAAVHLKSYCVQNYNESVSKAFEAMNSAGGIISSSVFYTLLSKIPGYGAGVAGTLGLYTLISNMDDVSLHHEYTCAKEQIANTLAVENNNLFQVSKNETYVYSSPKEYTKGKKLFYYLIMARKTAEESCLNYFKSEPFYTEWINNDCIVFSEKAISNLNTIQQKYYA